MSKARLATAVLAMAGVLGMAAGTASAAFPGSNGRIVFSRQGSPGMMPGIWVMDPDGQNQAQILTLEGGDDPPRPVFSPDGERMVYTDFVAGSLGLFAVDADGQNQAELFNEPGAYELQGWFTADGHSVVYTRMSGSDSEIYIVGVDGQNPIPLTDNAEPDFQPSVSPDGDRIAFARITGGDGEIFVMGIDGQNPVPVTDNSVGDSEPSFSPDGQKIVFTRSQMGDNEIFLMDPDGQNQVPLTDTPGVEFSPSFSPDGSKIAYARTDPMTDSEIFVMDSDGQNPVPLTSNTVSDTWSNWQPINPPALDLSADPKQKSAKSVTVTASSQNEDAAVVVDGTVKAPKPQAGAAVAKSKTYDLEQVALELAPGQPATVELAVPKKGRKALKKAFAAGKKGKAEIAATATDSLGASSQDDQQVKLKKKKK